MSNYSEIINFIRNQFPTKDFITLHEPIFNGNEKSYVLDTINSTFVSSVGSFVDQFESMISSLTNESSSSSLAS
jgi:dTDP-4-amino-4,6-dideoxygalactose transaminase